jgi:hypothetical protein
MNRFYHVLSLVIFGSFVAGTAKSAPSSPQRYPYDPVCAWGRIGDGRGMIVRCLTREEAQRLTTTALTPTKNPPTVSSAPVTTAPVATAPVTTAPVATTPVATTGSPTASTAPTSTAPLQAELVGLVAETGELPMARKKLAMPVDRYVSCVNTHGGLQGTTGQIVVRFIVTERGRAEGAGVEKFEGMTEAAAHCIADVVDRRPTGTPEAPIVEARVTLRISRKSTR